MSIEQKASENKHLYKRVPKIKLYRNIVSNDRKETYGVDLIDYTGSEKGSNRGYILVCIDYHSRFLMTKVITRKDKDHVEGALEDIFDTFGAPKNIHSDKESALINSTWLKNLGVNVYHSEGTDHNQSGGSPIAEAVIKTIRSKLEQYRDVTQARNWKQHVKKVTDEYNSETHSFFQNKFTPQQTFDEENGIDLDQLHYENRVRHNLKVYTKEKVSKTLQEDTKVLIPKEKKTFEKGFTKKWNPKVLQIVKVMNTKPITYQLSNGRFYYKEQLQFLNEKDVNVEA